VPVASVSCQCQLSAERKDDSEDEHEYDRKTNADKPLRRHVSPPAERKVENYNEHEDEHDWKNAER
jgi:hypothetical protein